MSILGAAAGYTLGATIGTNIVYSDTGFKGPYESLIVSVGSPFVGLLFSGGQLQNIGIGPMAPFASAAVGAYMGYTQKIPILRDYV